MADAPAAEEVSGWVGFRVDDVSGARVGTVEGAYADAASGRPVWLLVSSGRLGSSFLVPASDTVAAAGHVWVPWDRAAIRGAPGVKPGAALTAGEELELCAHYGFATGTGRAAELEARPRAEPSARPIE